MTGEEQPVSQLRPTSSIAFSGAGQRVTDIR
jgi:hypothetical protein